jgi:hypothetical protein
METLRNIGYALMMKHKMSVVNMCITLVLILLIDQVRLIILILVLSNSSLVKVPNNAIGFQNSRAIGNDCVKLIVS